MATGQFEYRLASITGFKLAATQNLAPGSSS